MAESARIQVLMPACEAEQFEAYCRDKGHKKSTLIARLVREHLAREGFAVQTTMTLDAPRRGFLAAK